MKDEIEGEEGRRESRKENNRHGRKEVGIKEGGENETRKKKEEQNR